MQMNVCLVFANLKELLQLMARKPSAELGPSHSLLGLGGLDCQENCRQN